MKKSFLKGFSPFFDMAEKKKLSGYQAFVKGQLNAGRTFKQAVKLWKKAKAEKKRKAAHRRAGAKKGRKVAKKIKRKALRKAKTRRVVRARPRALKAKRVKRKKIVRRKPVRKRGVRKPSVRTITRTRIVRQKPKTITKVVEKPIIVEKPSSIDMEKMDELMNVVKSNGFTDQETALRLVEFYFRDVALHSHKRHIDLDAMISAYKYALGKLKE